jgi:hypothetical protein
MTAPGGRWIAGSAEPPAVQALANAAATPIRAP